MGIGDFIKQQAGIGRLPESEINEVTIYKYLKGQSPFVVTLPILETIKTGTYTGYSETHNGFRTTYYEHPQTKKVFRKVKTTIQHTPQQIIISHALADGRHAYVDLTKPHKVMKRKDGLIIELHDGSRYIFEMDKEIKNFWKTKGFKPQAIINVFYNLLLGELPNELQQQIDKQNQQIAHQQTITKTKENRNANENLTCKQLTEEEIHKRIKKDTEKRQKQKEKEKRMSVENLVEEIGKTMEKEQKKNETKNKKIFNEFYNKIKLSKELYDTDAISQDEYIEIKKIAIEEIIDLPIPSDINPTSKLKEAKELLDIDAITQEDFENIKSKYLDLL